VAALVRQRMIFNKYTQPKVIMKEIIICCLIVIKNVIITAKIRLKKEGKNCPSFFNKIMAK
jgi:hypothetical protein